MQANRLYLFISQINHLIVRTPDEQTLFKEVCRIAVDTGKFRMAWIGLINEQSKSIQPVVHAGEEQQYLSWISITSIDNLPEGQEPTGTAIREGKYVFCNDIEKAPEMAPWKDAAVGSGYLSSISLPIRNANKVVGAFTLYASTTNFFNEEEIELLQGTTADISFALEIFEKEKLRKKAQQELLNSQLRYKTLTESSPVGIFHTDAAGYTTYVNPRWCEITGLLPEEGLGNGWLKAVHESDRDIIMKRWAEAAKIQGPSMAVYRFIRPDGKIAWVLGQAVPEINADNVTIGYIGTTTDITERKKAEEEIESILKYKETVLNRINDGMLSVDNEWRFTFLNDAALSTTSLSRDESIGKVMWDLHPEITDTIFGNMFHEAMRTRKAMEVEGFYTPLNTWYSTKIYPSEDGMTIFYRDITEKINAQNEILKEKNLSASIINSLPGIFYLLNKEGNFLRWNKNFETVSKFEAHEIPNLHALDFFDVGDKELIKEKLASTFEKGEDSIQADFQTKTKEKIPYYFTGRVIDYEGSPCLLGLGLDFSERMKAQNKINETTEQLRQLTTHLQTVREEERKRIGREIHDDLGQQLTAIKMDIAWIDKNISDESVTLKRKLKNVIELLDGSNQSIRRILSELRPVILDNRGLLEAMDWMGRQITANSSINVQFSSSEITIQLHETLSTCIFRVYQEALTNIVKHGGPCKVFTSLDIKGDQIRFSIIDTGCGFDPAAVQGNKSFGILGMKERVLSLGGSFELNSAPGQGTKILIYLPYIISTDR
jgi:PAS domain S-box-containing protein